MFKNTLQSWFPLAVVITCLAFLVFGVAQHILRIGGYDPQIQIAEDAAASLGKGIVPQTMIPNTPVDIAKSLSPFLIVYDSSRKVLISGGILGSTTPILPVGVFDYTVTHGEDRITWEPQPDVRIATIVTHYSGTFSGYAVSGRSLREVDNRISDLTFEVLIAWLFSLIVSFAAVVCVKRITSKD